jgi:hypothetical protein
MDLLSIPAELEQGYTLVVAPVVCYELQKIHLLESTIIMVTELG